MVHGAYGVTVNTRVCGALDSGSIPDRHPKKNKLSQESLFFVRESNQGRGSGKRQFPRGGSAETERCQEISRRRDFVRFP